MPEYYEYELCPNGQKKWPHRIYKNEIGGYGIVKVPSPVNGEWRNLTARESWFYRQGIAPTLEMK